MDEEIETGVEEVPVEGGDPLGAQDVEVADGGGESTLSMTQDERDKWGEASQLLFQPGYIHVLKQMALSGQMQMYNIRSVVWRVFLGCLPEEQSKWTEAVSNSRDIYNQLKKKHITDPHIASASLDVAINNPLSQAEDSPWHQFFQDNELRQMINQDVVRTFPDVAFFKQTHIQETMLDLLFIYSKEKPDLGYRQGMHEILAPILFVLHAEERDHDDNSLAPEVQVVMDSDYLEHDAYTIFAELMESMEQWYMCSALEVDYYKTRNQGNGNRRMQHDPRTQKPFEEGLISANSAISRKLEKIHQILLKKADEVLFTHLKELSIPAQTYGIRWIRLLFGREFPLPSVLELWDALFADGPSLGLIDYICVAMLMHIREVLIEGDYAVCMQHLMRFPNVYEVNYLVQRALHLRNPVNFPSPRIWTYHPSKVSRAIRPPSSAVTQLMMDERFSTGTGSGSALSAGGGVAGSASSASSGGGTANFKARAQQNTEKIADFFQNRLMPKSASGSSQSSSRQVARLEFQRSSSRSPSPNRRQSAENSTHLTDEQLFTGGSTNQNAKRTPRFNILGKKASKTQSLGKEMTDNPRAHPLAESSMSELERLTSRVEDLEAKCLYCGGKMESVIGTLQDEIQELPDLDPDTENTLYLAIAGLKQIRDLLLKKIAFSGDTTLGWDMKGMVGQKEHAADMAAAKRNEDLLPNPPPEGEEEVIIVGGADHTPNYEAEENSLKLEQSAAKSPSENSLSSMGDDWVNLSNITQPLVNSTD